MLFKYLLILYLNTLPIFGSHFTWNDVKVTYEDSTNDSTPNPLKGSEFRMTARFDPNLGDINFCTVKEVFLNQSLHFSEPKDDNHPDVTTVQNGRVYLDRSNDTECTVVVKKATNEDTGTWEFIVGYNRNQLNRNQLKWYQHRVIVKVKVPPVISPDGCEDSPNYAKNCKEFHWACNDSRYPWFKEQCKKSCKIC